MLLLLVLVAVVLVVLENSSQASSGAGDTSPAVQPDSGQTAQPDASLPGGPAPTNDPNAPMATTSMTKPTLTDLANAIAAHENANPEYNNPGDLRYNSVLTQPGYVEDASTGQAPNGMATFASFTDGWNALLRQLGIDFNRNPNQTLSDLITSYAPPSENNTSAYIADVSNRLGVSPDSKLSEIFSLGSAAPLPVKAGG